MEKQSARKASNQLRTTHQLSNNPDPLAEHPEPKISDFRFQLIDPTELVHGNLFDELVVAYRQIFGSPDIWGEGAYCSSNNTHLISLPEYNERLKAGDLMCGCGGMFKACYPDSSLRKNIAAQLAEGEIHKPFCAIMRSSQIEGFLWGVVAPVSECLERIRNFHCYGITANWHEEIMKLEQVLVFYGLRNNAHILYIDELGVLPSARKGMMPIISLMRLGLQHSLKFDCKKILCWTSRKAPVHKLACFAGFEEVYSTNGGIAFLYCDDFGPLYSVLQNRNPNHVVSATVASARAIKNGGKTAMVNE